MPATLAKAQQLLDLMRPIAADKIKFWREDFTCHDVRQIYRMRAGERYFWSLRETGTWLINLDNPDSADNKGVTIDWPLAILKNALLPDRLNFIVVVNNVWDRTPYGILKPASTDFIAGLIKSYSNKVSAQ